jgi:hypothetical protein
MARRKKANQARALLSGRGRRAPAWVRELERLGLGVRGQCPLCREWGTIRDGACCLTCAYPSTTTIQSEETARLGNPTACRLGFPN